MQGIPSQSETCECHAFREDMNAGLCSMMGILSGLAQTWRDGTVASGATPQHESEKDIVEISEEGGFIFERLKATKCAIYDDLYPEPITLKLVFEAFNVGYAHCLPKTTMQSKMREYAGTSRFGRSKAKKIQSLNRI